jgi:hypothetical protein
LQKFSLYSRSTERKKDDQGLAWIHLYLVIVDLKWIAMFKPST